MSLLRRVGRIAKGAAKGFVTGGGWTGAALGAVSSLRSAPRMPTSGPVMSPPMPSRVPAPRGGRTMPGGGVLTDAGIGVGGVLVGRAMSRGGQAPRRRRARGITGSEMKAFNRVTRILDKVCKTPPPTRRRGTGRRSSSCR